MDIKKKRRKKNFGLLGLLAASFFYFNQNTLAQPFSEYATNKTDRIKQKDRQSDDNEDNLNRKFSMDLVYKSLDFTQADAVSKSSEFYRFFSTAASRINTICEDKILFDFGLRSIENPTFDWQNERLTSVGKEAIIRGFGDALEQTSLYKNFEEKLSGLACTVVDGIFGEKFGGKINRFFGIDKLAFDSGLRSDQFEDPLIRMPLQDYKVSIGRKGFDINLTGENALRTRIEIGKLKIQYEKDIFPSTYLIIGGLVDGGINFTDFGRRRGEIYAAIRANFSDNFDAGIKIYKSEGFNGNRRAFGRNLSNEDDFGVFFSLSKKL